MHILPSTDFVSVFNRIQFDIEYKIIIEVLID